MWFGHLHTLFPPQSEKLVGTGALPLGQDLELVGPCCFSLAGAAD